MRAREIAILSELFLRILKKMPSRYHTGNIIDSKKLRGIQELKEATLVGRVWTRNIQLED